MRTHIHLHTPTYTHQHTHTHKQRHIDAEDWRQHTRHECVNAHAHSHINIRTHTAFEHTHTHTHTHRDTHTNAFTHTHVHTHTHMHTQVDTELSSTEALCLLGFPSLASVARITVCLVMTTRTMCATSVSILNFTNDRNKYSQAQI